MGMLDGMLGNVMGGLLGSGASGQQNPLLQMALQLLQQNGGVGGTLDKLRAGGYAEQADSWVAVGENAPIGADALQQLLGSGGLGNIAAKLGMSTGVAAGGLASILPQLIDQMTPKGQLPDEGDDPVSQALAMLQAKRSA